MAEDYIPDSFQNRYDWTKNIHDELDEHAAALSLDSGEVSAAKALLAGLTAKYSTVLDRQRDLDVAVGDANAAFDTSEAELRRMFGEWRKKAGYNDGIGRALGIATSSGKPDPATINPRLKLESLNGFIRITGRKNYAETVNIYSRLVGQTTWRLVIGKRKTFPFDDQTPLAQPGVAERREYMAIGCIGDDEIGQPSDIVQVLHG